MLWVNRKPSSLISTSFILQGFVLRVGLPFTSSKSEIISGMLPLVCSIPSALLWQQTAYIRIMTVCIFLFSPVFSTIWQGQMKTIMFLPPLSTHLDPTVEKVTSSFFPQSVPSFLGELCSPCFLSEMRENSHYLRVSFLPGPIYLLVFLYFLELEFSSLLVSLKMYFLFVFFFAFAERGEETEMFNLTILKQGDLYAIFDPMDHPSWKCLFAPL